MSKRSAIGGQSECLVPNPYCVTHRLPLDSMMMYDRLYAYFAFTGPSARVEAVR